MRTNVYIDGFNLYYGCVKDTAYRWLDVAALCRNALPGYPLHRIRYFTARIKPIPGDPQKPLRQQIFIRALETIPNLSVHYGQFLTHARSMRLVNPPPGGPAFVDVIRTEEKGSDVNLASYLLVDGYEDDYDVAVVVSNDSDLVEPIRLVQNRLRRKVGVLNPQNQKNPGHQPSWALKKAASFYVEIEEKHLRDSQFPTVLRDVHGTITKPATW